MKNGYCYDTAGLAHEVCHNSFHFGKLKAIGTVRVTQSSHMWKESVTFLP